jgi:predicted acyltransferase
MGVLQRIALCYFFGALIVHYCSQKTAVIISVLLLIGYWLFLILFGEPAKSLPCWAMPALSLDIVLLGNDHLYHDKGGPIAFDPEGLLSTLTGYSKCNRRLFSRRVSFSARAKLTKR